MRIGQTIRLQNHINFPETPSTMTSNFLKRYLGLGVLHVTQNITNKYLINEYKKKNSICI